MGTNAVKGGVCVTSFKDGADIEEEIAGLEARISEQQGELNSANSKVKTEKQINEYGEAAQKAIDEYERAKASRNAIRNARIEKKQAKRAEAGEAISAITGKEGFDEYVISDIFEDCIYWAIMKLEVFIKDNIYQDHDAEGEGWFSLAYLKRSMRRIIEAGLDTMFWLLRNPRICILVSFFLMEWKKSVCRDASLRAGRVELVNTREEMAKRGEDDMSRSLNYVTSLGETLLLSMENTVIADYLTWGFEKIMMMLNTATAGQIGPIVNSGVKIFVNFAADMVRVEIIKKIYSFSRKCCRII